MGCQWASGGVGVSGVYWKALRDSRYSGARRGIGASGGIGSHLGDVGDVWELFYGCQGASGGYWGWQGL